MMGNKQAIVIPFSNGLDTSIDDKLLPIDKLSVAENVTFVKRGRLNKRSGYRRTPTELIDGSGITTASFGLHAFDQQFLKSDGGDLLSYVSSKGKWSNVGLCPHLFSTNVIASSTGLDQHNPTSVSIDGLNWFAYESNGSIKVTVIDQATGQNIASDIVVSSGFHPTLVNFDDSLIIVHGRGNELNVIRMSLNKLLNGDFSTVYVIEGLDANGTFDVHSTSSHLLIAFSSASQTSLYRFDTNYNILSVQNISQGSEIALDLSSDIDLNVYIASIDATNNVNLTVVSPEDATLIQPSILNMTLSSSDLMDPNPTGLAIFPSIQSGSQRFVAGTIQGSSRITNQPGGSINEPPRLFVQADDIVYALDVTLSGSVASSSSNCQVLACDSVIVSKPFSFSGYSMIATALTASVVSDNVIIDADTGNALARTNVELAGTRSSSSLAPYDPTCGLALERFAFFPSAETLGALSVSSFVLDSDVQQSIVFHDNLHIPGSIMRSYDGARTFETGFLTYPEIKDVRVMSPGTLGLTGAIEAGTYLYAFTYEWIDVQGQTHESAPSVLEPVEVTASSSTVAFHVTALHHTLKPGVRLIGYRSAQRFGDASLQTPLRQFTSITVPNLSVPLSLGNVVVDDNSDADIASNRTLYTIANDRNNPNTANAPPPPNRFAAVKGNRMFVLSSDDANTIHYSKNSVSGEPLSFALSDDFAQTIQDDDNEDVTAIAALDSNLIIFKPTRILSLPGEGPNNFGEDNNFGEPVLITSDVGCDQPQSIREVSGGEGGFSGITFKSKQGIYLLDRGLSTSYIGEPVRDLDPLTIVKAVHVPSQDQVRFLTSDTENGYCIVFNYRLNQWATWTNHLANDGVLVADTFYYSRPDGTILVETPGQFDDDGIPIPMKVVTAQVSVAGLNGHMRLDRLWLLGERKGPHKLRISVYFDNSPQPDGSWIEDFDIDDVLETPQFSESSQPDFTQRFNRYELGMRGSKRCSSFKVQIEDIQNGINTTRANGDPMSNEGLSLSAMTCVVRIAPGLNRLTPKQRGQ